MANKKREGKKKDVTNEIVTREYTINLHKRIHGV
jgi:large subunit ribosomal protein L31e